MTISCSCRCDTSSSVIDPYLIHLHCWPVALELAVFSEVTAMPLRANLRPGVARAAQHLCSAEVFINLRRVELRLEIYNSWALFANELFQGAHLEPITRTYRERCHGTWRTPTRLMNRYLDSESSWISHIDGNCLFLFAGPFILLIRIGPAHIFCSVYKSSKSHSMFVLHVSNESLRSRYFQQATWLCGRVHVSTWSNTIRYSGKLAAEYRYADIRFLEGRIWWRIDMPPIRVLGGNSPRWVSNNILANAMQKRW